MLDKIIKELEKCKGNKLMQVGFISLSVLIVAIISTIVYLYWQIVFLVGAVIAYLVHEHYEQKKQFEAQKLQKIYNLKESAVYTLRHAFTGLESLFGIPAIPNKGFYNIINRMSKNATLYFVSTYTRLPNLPDLTPDECGQLREMFNSAIQGNRERLPYENVVYVDVYVPDVKALDGKLFIVVIPLISDTSIETMNNHRRYLAKQAIIGKTEKDKTKINNDEVLKDEEL